VNRAIVAQRVARCLCLVLADMHATVSGGCCCFPGLPHMSGSQLILIQCEGIIVLDQPSASQGCFIRQDSSL
jgi:hypothetical protein